MTGHDVAFPVSEAANRRIQEARDGIEEKLHELERRFRMIRPAHWMKDPWLRLLASVAMGASIAVGRKNVLVRRALRFAVGVAFRRILADLLTRRD